jgi:hypothetical protein
MRSLDLTHIGVPIVWDVFNMLYIPRYERTQIVSYVLTEEAGIAQSV